MSTFLGFTSNLMPIGSTTQTVQNTLQSILTGYGWQCLRQALIPVATLGNLGTVATAFNLNDTSSSNSSSELPLWIGAQLTNPFTPTAFYVTGSSIPSYNIRNFTLDYSDNGSTWTTLQTWTGEINWVACERRKYVVSGASGHTYWRLNITANNGGDTTDIYTFTLEDASKNWVTTKTFLDVCPPVTETIGNSMAKDFLRIAITSSAIYLRPLQELLTALPQYVTFDTPTAGAVTLSITVNGTTVSYTGTSGNSALQNARGLYEAIKNSADTNFTSCNWYWGLPNTNITMVKKAYASNVAVTSSNITTRLRGASVLPQATGNNGNGFDQELTIDLINGFIYYLQVCSRGIALAIKTNSNFYGPLHACYGDNASAVAQTPQADTPDIPCTPIELLVGYDEQNTSYTSAFGKPSHYWGITNDDANTYQSDMFNSYDPCSHPFTRGRIGYQIMDWVGAQNTMMWNQDPTSGDIGAGFCYLLSEGVFGGQDMGATWAVHRMSCVETSHQKAYPGGRSFGLVFNNLDWYRACGTITNEQMVLFPSIDYTTTIATNATNTDSTITVASTIGFPTSGIIIINGEVITYTGISGNSFTGCTRGQYATTALSAYIGDVVNIGAWLVKINYGYLFAGYQTPS